MNLAPRPFAARRLAAFLLPALPAAVAMASHAHGHGALSGQGLGMIVLLTIAAGAAMALRLLGRAGRPGVAGTAAAPASLPRDSRA